VSHLMYIAVKLDCLHPRSTEVKDFKSYNFIKNLGPDWLVYEMETVRNSDGSLILLTYDHETDTHLKRTA
jgi:hypothetical protein